MSELPANWTTIPLASIADVQLGKMLDSAKNSGTSYRYLRNLNIRWLAFNLEDVQQLRMLPDEAEKFKIVDGDVLVCEGGEPGRCAVWRSGATDLVYQKALHRVRINGTLKPELFAWQMWLDAWSGRLKGLCSGSTIQHLTRVSILRYPVRLPPAAEQQRIADKIDTVLARVDACRDRLARVAPLLKRFRQSVLAAATSGRLTENWRHEREPGWDVKPLGELCLSISDGPFGSHLKSDDYVETGIRVVRLENIGHLFFDRSKETYISEKKYASLTRHTVNDGDLLFSSFLIRNQTQPTG